MHPDVIESGIEMRKFYQSIRDKAVEDYKKSLLGPKIAEEVEE